jgi:predicted porin
LIGKRILGFVGHTPQIGNHAMKKSMLALAVAAALAAPLAAQADTILYGSARVSVDFNDETVPDGVTVDPATGNLQLETTDVSYWDVVNNDSRLGVMGNEDLGGGLSAVYQYEFGVDVTEGGNLESNRPQMGRPQGRFWHLDPGHPGNPLLPCRGRYRHLQ